MTHYFNYKNLSVFVKIEGGGVPLLLLHGYLENHTVFEKIVPSLSDKYKVIMVDFPGHGKSACPVNNYSFEEFASLIAGLLEWLEVREKVHLAGHSMGGYAVLAFAKLYSERVRSLSLFHSVVSAASPKGRSQRLREASLIEKGRKELLVNALIGSNFAKGNETVFKSDLIRLKNMGNEVTEKGALAAINAMVERAASHEITERAEFPKLFIIGGKDQVFSPELQISEASSAKCSTIVMLENSGHVGFIEEEGVFVEGLKSFLSAV